MVIGIQDSVAIAKAWARRLSIIYIGVLALWVMVQSGIRMAPYLDLVYLAGLPDVPESRPHSQVNSRRFWR